MGLSEGPTLLRAWGVSWPEVLIRAQGLGGGDKGRTGEKAGGAAPALPARSGAAVHWFAQAAVPQCRRLSGPNSRHSPPRGSGGGRLRPRSWQAWLSEASPGLQMLSSPCAFSWSSLCGCLCPSLF